MDLLLTSRQPAQAQGAFLNLTTLSGFKLISVGSGWSGSAAKVGAGQPSFLSFSNLTAGKWQ